MGCGSSAASDSISDLGTNSKCPSGLKTNSVTGFNNNKEDDDSLGNEDDRGSRVTCRDSGIDSAKTTKERRIPNNENGNMRENQQESAYRSSNSKGVAFSVAFDGADQQDSIIKRHPPKRLLQKLEHTPPKLTAEMLAERQQLTEERRKKIVEGRAKSAKRTSRCRKDILAAKNFSEKELVEGSIKKINEKMVIADNNRANVQEEIKTKQRQRETRARQARERAQKINNAGTEELDFDIEKDEMFNNDDADSWLDGDNNTTASKGSTSSERIYDGRSSPMKKFNPVTSAHRRRKQHSPNTDSDTEEQSWANNSKGHQQEDDFFDT